LRHRWSRRVVPVLVCCFLLTAAAVAAWADRKPRDPAALTTVEALEALIGDSERNALDLDRISAELRAEGPVRGRAQETMRATGIETERLRGNPELARYRQALADVRAGRPLRPEMEAEVAALRASRAVTAYQREVARRTRLASIGRLLGADHDEIGRAVAAARRDARRRIAEARAILADVRKQWPDPANRPPEHNHLAEAAAEQLRGAQAELDVLPGLESEGKAAIARRLAKARKAAGPSGGDLATLRQRMVAALAEEDRLERGSLGDQRARIQGELEAARTIRDSNDWTVVPEPLRLQIQQLELEAELNRNRQAGLASLPEVGARAEADAGMFHRYAEERGVNEAAEMIAAPSPALADELRRRVEARLTPAPAPVEPPAGPADLVPGSPSPVEVPAAYTEAVQRAAVLRSLATVLREEAPDQADRATAAAEAITTGEVHPLRREALQAGLTAGLAPLEAKRLVAGAREAAELRGVNSVVDVPDPAALAAELGAPASVAPAAPAAERTSPGIVAVPAPPWAAQQEQPVLSALEQAAQLMTGPVSVRGTLQAERRPEISSVKDLLDVAP